MLYTASDAIPVHKKHAQHRDGESGGCDGEDGGGDCVARAVAGDGEGGGGDGEGGGR